MSAVLSRHFTSSPLSTPPSTSTSTTSQLSLQRQFISQHITHAEAIPSTNRVTTLNDQSEHRSFSNSEHSFSFNHGPPPTASRKEYERRVRSKRSAIQGEKMGKLERAKDVMAKLKANPPTFTTTNLISRVHIDRPLHPLITNATRIPTYLTCTPIVQRPRGRIKSSKLMKILADVQSNWDAEDELPFRVAFGFANRGDNVSMRGDNSLSSSTPYVDHLMASDQLYPPVNPNVNGIYTKKSELMVIPKTKPWEFPPSNAYFAVMQRGEEGKRRKLETIPASQVKPLFGSTKAPPQQLGKINNETDMTDER